MKFARSRRQNFLLLLNFLALAGMGVWMLRDGFAFGSVWQIVLGGLFAVWAAFVLGNLLRRRYFAELDADGITVHRPLHSIRVDWADLRWADFSHGQTVGVFGYRKPDMAEEKATGIVIRLIGEPGRAAIEAAIAANRPGLPRAPISDTPTTQEAPDGV